MFPYYGLCVWSLAFFSKLTLIWPEPTMVSYRDVIFFKLSAACFRWKTAFLACSFKARFDWFNWSFNSLISSWLSSNSDLQPAARWGTHFSYRRVNFQCHFLHHFIFFLKFAVDLIFILLCLRQQLFSRLSSFLLLSMWERKVEVSSSICRMIFSFCRSSARIPSKLSAFSSSLDS